jgi:hypothetical protein
LAAQREAGTPVTSVQGLFGRNAEANTGRSFVDLSTPSLAGKGDQFDPTIEAKADAPKPFRDALPKPFRVVVPKAPVVDVPKAPVVEVLKAPVVDVPKAPVVEVPKKTDDGNGLVRNSPKFSPNTTILPVGSQSGAGAGGWNLFQGIKDAVDGFTGGGGSLTGSATATKNGDGKG